MKSRMPTAEEMAGALGLRRGPPPPGAVEATSIARAYRIDELEKQLRETRRAFWSMTAVVGFLAVFLVAGAVGAHRDREACSTPIFIGTDIPGGPRILLGKPMQPRAQTTAGMLPWWHPKKVWKV